MTSMAPEAASGAANRSFPNGGSAVRISLMAKSPRETGRIRAALIRLMDDLGHRAASGEDDAVRDLYRMHTTLSGQRTRAARTLRDVAPEFSVKAPRDSSEVAAAAGRVFKALAKRGGEGDIEALAEMVRLQSDLREQTAAAARALNVAGFSWRQIGEAAGITAQTAHERFGERK